MRAVRSLVLAGLALVAAACGASPSATSALPGSGDKTKVAFALHVARCMRSRGYPTYPDPNGSNASSQGGGTRFDGTGIDTRSPRFQVIEAVCEKQSRKALGLP